MPELPTLSVVVLNYNGRAHLQPCFQSLTQMDYPAAQLELILVDNGSTDGSLAFMQANFPTVRLVVSPQNLGFAAGNNLGAREATGQKLIFLNNDMRVDPQFPRALVAAQAAEPDVVCVGGKILNWDGTTIDFAGAAAHFAALAYQDGYGQPASSPAFNQVTPILFACGGAMLIDRAVFLETGGFDEDYFALYEDLDLGWRLWVLGYRVLFAPAAIAFHRHHGTLDRFQDYRKQVLYRRNPLYTLYKNYSDENLNRVLPAAVLGTVSTVTGSLVRSGRLDPQAFRLNGAPAAAGTIPLDRHDAATLVALEEFIAALPRLAEKRHQVQQHRRRPDDEILPLFRWPFRAWPEVSGRTQYAVAQASGVPAAFRSLNRRVLVISSDILPYPGLPTVGSGLRAWGLGQGLRSRGHEVVFSMPREAIAGRESLVPPEAKDLAWTMGNLEAVVRAAQPDAVVVCNWPVLALLPTDTLGLPVALDQHGPHLIEREFQGAGTPAENTHYKLLALRKADFFTCAGHKQLGYFQQWLTRAGWTETERQRHAAAIPVSLSPDLPDRQPDPELSFVYGGVFLPWQDPSAALFALVEALEARQRGRLYFYGGRHPFYAVDPGVFEPLAAKLKQSQYVTAPGMVSHDELIERYRRAHVALDVMQRNVERELAFTTRTVEYLWCGLPVIYHDYAELSDYIREYEAGWTVDPADGAALRQVLATVFDNPAEVARRGQNAQRLVRERLTWDQTIEPLDDFIRMPRLRDHALHEAAPPLINNARYLAGMAWSTYRRHGARVLWREGLAFMRRRGMLR